MPAPVHITFRHMPHSDALAARIQDWAARTEKFCPDVQSWRVAVESPQPHPGRVFSVHVEAVAHGEVFMIDRTAQDPAHSNAYVAVADAFRAMKRRLHERVRARRESHRVGHG